MCVSYVANVCVLYVANGGHVCLDMAIYCRLGF